MTQERGTSRFAELGARSHMLFELRLVRYTIMLGMRSGAPPFDRKMSLQEVANEMERLGFGRLSRERVRQVIHQGRPVEHGDDGASFAWEPEELQRRIQRWTSRRSKRGDARAGAYRRELDERGRASK
jgi:hypothetical protein